MVFSIILLFALNIIFATLLAVFWVRSRKAPQDDPRLSRGLQLLQSKISVLEDLSDRADVQVKQLCHLLDKKCQQVQGKLTESKDQISLIEQSMLKSREVASIFQDKIPHEEIIERKNTIKYVKAAQMAHQGLSPEDIAKEMGLPLSEVNFIAKVNKNELVFDKDRLPDWVNAESARSDQDSINQEAKEEKTEFKIEMPKEEVSVNLQKIGKEFRKINQWMDVKNEDGGASKILQKAKDMSEKIIHKAEEILEDHELSAAPSKNESPRVVPTKTVGIEPVDFPKVDFRNNIG